MERKGKKKGNKERNRRKERKWMNPESPQNVDIIFTSSATISFLRSVLREAERENLYKVCFGVVCHAKINTHAHTN
jgi:predicted amidophosphoribosyltransferase